MKAHKSLIGVRVQVLGVTEIGEAIEKVKTNALLPSPLGNDSKMCGINC